MLCAAAYLVWVTGGSGFYQDELSFFYSRLDFSADSLLQPYINNLTAISLLLYQETVKVFGLDDARLPIRLVWIATDLACSGLLFIYLRRRTLAWFAFLPSCLLLVFGTAWTYTATTLGVVEFIPVALGLGALVALDERSRGGDLLTSGLLTAALLAHSASLPFVVGVAATVFLQGMPEAWRRAWVWAIPLAIYLVWVVWARFAYPGSPADLANLVKVPGALLDGVSTVIAGIGGRFLTDDAGRIYKLDNALGIPAALLLAAWAGWLALRRRFPREALVGLSMLLAYWFLIGLAISPARQPTSDRYLYLGAVLLAITLAPLLPRRSPPLLAWAAIAIAFVVLSLAPNIRALSQAADNVETVSDQTRAGLTAIELARGSAAPAFDANDAVPGLALYLPSDAGTYLATVQRYGSPAFSEGALVESGGDARRVADAVLVAALALHLSDEVPADNGQLSCRRLPRIDGVGRVLPGERITITVETARAAEVTLGRFADTPTVSLGRVPGDTEAVLAIPADRSKRPWRMQVNGVASLAACG